MAKEMQGGPDAVEQPILERILAAMLEDLHGDPEFDQAILSALRELAEKGRLSSPNRVLEAITPPEVSA
jgi:hypothetical protein